jgi:pimeloyl-ACP methyl ester carboxylesterase
MYDRLTELTAGMITPLEVRGLRGRMMVHPSRRADGGGRTIIFVYGIHASLERFYGVIHFFARFGRVMVPDLPGFGGMEPFYKVGQSPSLDGYGDYLAKFIEQEAPEGELTLVGLSYGFMVITRMLQRHAELHGRVRMILSVMGLALGRDLALKPVVRWLGIAMFAAGKRQPLAELAQFVMTRPWVLKLSYGANHPKMQALAPEERPDFIAFEAFLWRCNDMRTYCSCLEELFRLHDTGARVPLEVQHIDTANDHWLNVRTTERDIRAQYADLTVHHSNLRHHGGTAYTDETEPEVMIPATVQALLEAVT